MLSETSKTGLRALIFIAGAGDAQPCSPARIAASIGASPSYMAKINTLLVKASILQPFRGKHGGVRLSRAAQDVTLLEIVEACQGKVLADYCQEHRKLCDVCGFHHAMHELQEAIVSTLEKWTLADLVARPTPRVTGIPGCRMLGVPSAHGNPLPPLPE